MSTESCRGAPGKIVPVIDRNRCEGKAACVAVCPCGVFEIRALSGDDRASLSLRGRLKAWAHGGRQAYVARPDDCHACGRCVPACPEGAISLGRAT
jgi:NAD-dependent dihydropyrimidine dehydrogenase PreA subunit